MGGLKATREIRGRGPGRNHCTLSSSPWCSRPYAHFTRFVRDILLGQLGARSYKRPREKWEIAEAGFQHMRSVLASAAAAGDLSALVAADAAGYRPPGIEVMLDMLKVPPPSPLPFNILGSPLSRV